MPRCASRGVTLSLLLGDGGLAPPAPLVFSGGSEPCRSSSESCRPCRPGSDSEPWRCWRPDICDTLAGTGCQAMWHTIGLLAQ